VPYAIVSGSQLAAAPRPVKYGEADAQGGVPIADGYSVIQRLLDYPA
jgi:hypothetical protein